jgi:drug/metabolite transporter (DMT)-like permease
VNCSIVFFIISDTIKKDSRVTYGVTPYEFNILRSIVAGTLSFIIAYRNGDTNFIPYSYGSNNKKFLIWRTVVMSCAMYLCLFCLSILPITIWAIVTNLQPFFIALIQAFVMKQTISKFEIGAIIGSFAGILMISLGKPEDGGADSARIASLAPEWLGVEGMYVLGIGLACFCAVLFSCVGLLTREL